MLFQKESLAEEVATSRDIAIDLSYATYAQELLRRAEFVSQGGGVLSLWRSIAWEGNRRKKGFELTSQRVLDAESAVRARIQQLVG